MSLFEIVERLCEVTKLQADIIQKQTEALEQAKISDKVAEELQQIRDTAAVELDLVNNEYN